MLEIKFEINGKRVNPRNIGDVLERSLYEKIIESISNKVKTAKCPKHNQAPEIICKGRTLDNINFEIKGCCEDLIEDVKRQLK